MEFKEIYNGKLFNEAPENEKLAVREDYFNKVIRPKIKDDDPEAIKKDFFSKYPLESQLKPSDLRYGDNLLDKIVRTGKESIAQPVENFFRETKQGYTETGQKYPFFKMPLDILGGVAELGEMAAGSAPSNINDLREMMFAGGMAKGNIINPLRKMELPSTITSEYKSVIPKVSPQAEKIPISAKPKDVSTDEFINGLYKHLNDSNLSSKEPSSVNQFESILSKTVDKNTPYYARQKTAELIADETAKVKDKPFKGLEKLKSVAGALWDMYKRPPEVTEYKKIMGQYLGDQQVSNYEGSQFAKWIQKNIPAKRQEAIFNWIEAGGNVDTLKKWESGSFNKFKKGYKAAQELTSEEMSFAQDVGKYYNDMFDKAHQEGILDHALENYVNHVYKGDKNIIVRKAGARKFLGELNSGLLRENPSFAKQRVHEVVFDAEQSGLNPEKRIGYNITAYQQSLNEAINARATVKKLLDGKAKDGRPLVHPSGYGKLAEDNTQKADAFIIKPKGLSGEFGDYRSINHPALRKWKWVGNEGDTNLIMQGDLVVHPEVYNHLKNVLGQSKVTNTAIRIGEDIDIYPGRALLQFSTGFKNTMLSLSPFHQVHIGTHALEHKINPTFVSKVNINDPITRKGINNGLMLFNHNPLNEFSEGVYSTGLINKIPGVGTLNQKYGHYMFNDWLPRLKNEAFKDIYARNIERYSKKLSDDQISVLSAKQVNAAFSEQNYKYLGRNPTTQDVLRLIALAPQFLEDRLKFAGQAMRPYGKEQAAALIRGAIGMFAGAKILNTMLDGDPHFDKPFSIIINKREYALRSVQGDIGHLLSDPRSFVYHRLNPMTSRTMIEYLSSKDAFGRKKDVKQQITDFIKTIEPIPLQGLHKKDYSLWQSVLQSVGITNYPSRKEKDSLKISDIKNFK